MTTEQLIVRWVLVVPTLLLMLWFLPIRGGGYQYAGVFDGDFLTSGAVDVPRLMVQVIAVLLLWAMLEQYAYRSMDL